MKKHFRNALVKCDGFKGIVKELKERLSVLTYIHAVRIEYCMTLKIKIVYHHPDWPDEQEYCDFRFQANPEDTIVGSELVDHIGATMLKLMIQHFLNSYQCDVEEWHKIDKIIIEDSNFYITKLITWDSDSVSIYWVEQECGEHWITLPKEPKRDMAIYLTEK